MTNLDIELQCSPTLHDHGVLVLGHAKSRTEGTSEDAGDRRFGSLRLVETSEPADAERGATYRSCHHRPILTPNLHPPILLRRLFLAFLGMVGGLSGRLGRNRGEERQQFVLKRVKVKAQELLRVLLMPTLRHKLR